MKSFYRAYICQLITLCLVVCSSTSFAQHTQEASMADYKAINKNSMVQDITLSAIELNDATGLKYIGGLVQNKVVEPYLSHLKMLLPKQFERYRANQQQRDHHQFHITLVNPYEYQKIAVEQLTKALAQQNRYEFRLYGLGQASNDQSRAYFVVARSRQAQMLRKTLGLSVKDFHITLGFLPTDVFGVSKGQDSLIR